MLKEIKQAVVDELARLYPATEGYTIYDDNIPQNFATPSFQVSLVNQDRSKGIGKRYKNRLSFDVSYFSNATDPDIKNDCYGVQETILREFDLIGTYRAKNLNARITDNVLHVIFDISYSEVIAEGSNPMQQLQTNTTI